MKKIIFSLAVMFFLTGTMSVFAQSKTEVFKVFGNCGMCENRIETAANSVDGVTSADWNSETKMLQVSYDKSKTDNHKIHQAVADAGYDTNMHKATDKVYETLPACCKYDREGDENHKKKMNHH